MSKFIGKSSILHSSIYLSVLVGLIYEQMQAAAFIVCIVWSIFLWLRSYNGEETMLRDISDVFINIVAVSIIEIIKAGLPAICALIGVVIVWIFYAALYLKKYIIK